MKTVLPGIWILVLALTTSEVGCQEDFSPQDLIRLRQLSAAADDNHAETVTGYNTNVVHRDPATNEHSVSSVSVQFRMKEDSDAQTNHDDFQRSARSDQRRKIFHIKNPFQREEGRQNSENYEIDSDPGASNQYASMQYSLPPEGFLNQMRAEGQFIQQYSTPAPALSYATTPQPQYQYQTASPGGYDPNQPPPNPMSHQQYNQNFQAQPQDQNSYYNFLGSSSYSSEGPSTPSPQIQYVSTPSPSGQFVGTPNSPTYVSSDSPSYISSPSSQLQYLSSPSSLMNTGLSDYGNRLNNPGAVSSFEANQNSNMFIDHYNNAINGVRYPFNGQSQPYQHEFSSTTMSPSSSSIFPERTQDTWRNPLNSGVNSLPKSIQDSGLTSNSQQESASTNEKKSFNENGDTHRIGNNMQSANNLYMNFMQPDYQLYQNTRTRTRDLEQETGQPDIYSHGDYGWKLSGKRPLAGSDTIAAGSYSHMRPLTSQLQSNQPADNSYSKYYSSSQTSFQGDSQKPQNVNLGYSIGFNSQRPSSNDEFGGKSSSSENFDTEEFVKAAAKVHENMKNQQSQRSNEPYYGHDISKSVVTYTPNNNYYSNSQPSNVVSTYYGNNDKQQRENKYYSESTTKAVPYSYGFSQNDLVTSMPYLYGNIRNGNIDSKTKQPFDHAKALKNILPIDVSNVLSSQENGIQSYQNFINNQRLNAGSKDEIDNNIKKLFDHYKPLTDAYYKDKNTGYGLNIKTRPDNYGSSADSAKPSELLQFNSNKHTAPETSFSQDFSHDNKRYADSRNQQGNFQQQSSNSYQQQIQPSASMQQNSYRPQDISNIFKLTDIPYKLSQNSLSHGLGALNSYDKHSLPDQIPNRINQNVGVHQLDATNSLLSKLNLFGSNNQFNGNFNSPSELDPQNGGVLSTINGIRVANPFNVDLKLISDMLKGKPAVDESQMIPLRNNFNRLLPMNLDMSSIQQILSKSENSKSTQDLGVNSMNKDFNHFESLAPLTAKYREVESEGYGSLGPSFGNNPFNSGRYPFQNGVKYSRSQEEEENETIIPAADGSNTHQIGAVVEQDNGINLRESNGESESTGQDDESLNNSFKEHRPKLTTSFDLRDHRIISSPRHPNSLYAGRHHYYRKHLKDGHYSEPYPLLKPPRPPRSRVGYPKSAKSSRRRRLPKSKINRMMNTQPLFESEVNSDEVEENTPVPIVLRPLPPSAQKKSDDDAEQVQGGSE